MTRTLCTRPALAAVLGLTAAIGGVAVGYTAGTAHLHRWRARCAHWAHLATHDPLTGLLNRRGWTGRIAAAHTGVIGMLDLDDLKAVNDSRGHAAGDLMVATAAARAAAVIAAHAGLIARLGGDEFALWLPADRSPQSVPDAVREAISQPADHPILAGLRPAASLGLAGLDTAGPAVALQRADAAMYRAKRDGLGTAYYDPAIDHHSRRPRPRHRLRDQRTTQPTEHPAAQDDEPSHPPAGTGS